MPSLHRLVLRPTPLFYQLTMRPLRRNRKENLSTHNLLGIERGAWPLFRLQPLCFRRILYSYAVNTCHCRP
jgi:hypothetical protein